MDLETIFTRSIIFTKTKLEFENLKCSLKLETYDFTSTLRQVALNAAWAPDTLFDVTFVRLYVPVVFISEI